MPKLALLRHGESTWTQEYRFTGWTNLDLTPQGIEGPQTADRQHTGEGFQFERGHRSF